LAFTSTNGLKYFLANEQGYILLKYKTIFSISGKTKQTLTEQGFETAATAENAAQLAVKITQSTASSVLHPCSCTRLNDLETGLRTSAINY
ncbi:uroporphyrinogen-III synthase, partial [Klebsiella pneumoniae]|uniref:uroporphyrinogen-III synthase n=1 Tax=Klebsiella pneumoniae TaxID=573 RepID=UPI0013D34BBE